MMHGDIAMIVRDLVTAGEVNDEQAAAFTSVVSGMSDADQRALLGVLMDVYDAWGQACSDVVELEDELREVRSHVVSLYARGIRS